MYEAETIKTVITKNTILKEAMEEDRKHVIFSIVWALAFVLGGVFVFLFLYFLAFKAQMNAVSWIILIVCMMPSLILSAIFLLPTITNRSYTRKLKESDLFVVTDEVVYKGKITERHRRYVHEHKIIRFRKHGDIRDPNYTWYQLTEEDDVYIMVYRDPQLKCLLRYYPAKLYEYKE